MVAGIMARAGSLERRRVTNEGAAKMDLSSLWGLLTVVGPILLVAVLLWAVLNNRRSKRGEQHSEAATRNLYESIDREDKAAERPDV